MSTLSQDQPEDEAFAGTLRAAVRSPLTWILLLLGYAFYIRVWGLAEKVMHHDESLFAYYGYWLYRGNGYDYQPILHGPVLQFASAFFFLLFGDDQWTMRLPNLVGGLLMFPVAWCYRRYIGGIAGVLAVTCLIALSPSITYYTRFLRNDVPYLTATMWTGYSLLRALQTARPAYVWGAVLGATLMFCMMESSIFFFAACVGYLVTMALADLVVWRRPSGAPASDSGAGIGYIAAAGEHEQAVPEINRPWPAWLREDDRRWALKWPAHRDTLRGIDYLFCMIAALAITVAGGWLFYRVLYATLHIYKPVQAVFSRIGLNVSPTAANWMIAFVVLVAVYLLSLLVLVNVRRPRGRYGFVGWFGRAVWINRWHVVGGLAAAVIIYQTLFTTFFTFTSTASFDHGTRDFSGETKALTPVQIYKNTWDYWWDQHKLHRIKGPFHYYLPILFHYELPVIVLAVLGWLRALRKTGRFWIHGGLLLTMHAVLALVIWALPPIDWDMMDKKFHITHEAHLFLILLYAQLLVYVAPMLFLQGRKAESFITYWGITNLFAYSYAGEKVPWLTIHTTGPLALLAGAELARLARGMGIGRRVASPVVSMEPWGRATWQQTAFVCVAIGAVVFQLRNNHLLNIVHPWSPAERLVYNHTSPDIHKVMEMTDEIAHKSNFGEKLPILIQGEMGWPLHWYMREYSNITAPVGESAENTTRPVVMVDWHLAGMPNLQENYRIRRMKVREWWEPEMLTFSAMADIYLVLAPSENMDSGPAADRYLRAKAEWRKLWHYLAYREIWIDPTNPSWSNGANEFAYCVRLDIEERLMNYNWLAVTPKRTDVPVFVPY